MSKVLCVLVVLVIVAFVVDAVNQGKQQGQHLTGVNANVGAKVGKREAGFAGEHAKPKREAGDKSKPKRAAGDPGVGKTARHQRSAPTKKNQQF
ncbi:hypothetical protein AAVH_21284 [Aphelenchoides avenae]|nr:hypothetical protein AAVH_21284 [Aphelenchus avenae]